MITIAWDIDDVLNDLMTRWLEYYRAGVNPGCTVKYEEIRENPPHGILGIETDAYLKSLDEYRLTRYLAELNPVEDMINWFSEHGQRYRHIALTAVPLKASHISSFWLFKHFGRWIRTFHLVPSMRAGEDIPLYDKDKKEFMGWIGRIDVMVDDNEAVVAGAIELGIRGILVPQPWNRAHVSREGILKELAEL